MAVTLSPLALASIEAARSLILRVPDPTQATDKDDVLTRYINAYSTVIRRYCGRQFFPDPLFVDDEDTADPVTYMFTYDGNGFLSLQPFELREVEDGGIVVIPSGADSGTVLDPTKPEVTLEPRQRTEEGTYLWMRLLQFDNPRAFPPRMNTGLLSTVQITGRWGMVAVPEDVETACLMSVEERFKNPTGARDVNSGALHLSSYVPTRGMPPPLPPLAIAMLENVRRSETSV